MKRSSKDNAVIVTWASSAYLDFLRNWVHYITSWDVDNILIGETCSLSFTHQHQNNAAAREPSTLFLQFHSLSQGL